jgi:uncharacterized protein (DUF305 family)
MPASRHTEANMHHPYRTLLISAATSFVLMYILIYAMVDGVQNILANLNQATMAGLMTAPMVATMLLLMPSMYPDKGRNRLILALSAVALALSFMMIRRQTVIGDSQFLRSMIPHHAGAILMCREAGVTDSEIQALCDSIVASQQREIDVMKAKLAELER